MAATEAEITRLRRMVAEPDDTNGYTDDVLAEAIERYPLLDEDGLDYLDTDWIETYCLNSAAADVWGEKASSLVGGYDFTADGASFSRSQAHAQAARQQRYYAARRAPGTITLVRDYDETLEEEEV